MWAQQYTRSQVFGYTNRIHQIVKAPECKSGAFAPPDWSRPHEEAYFPIPQKIAAHRSPKRRHVDGSREIPGRGNDAPPPRPHNDRREAMDKEPMDPVVSVGGIRAEIGSDGRLVYLSETGVSDVLWLNAGDVSA